MSFGSFESYRVIYVKVIYVSNCVIVLFQKKSKQGGGGVEDSYTFLKTPAGIFHFFTSGNSRQNKARPLNIPQNCVRSLGNSKAKNKDPWKFHIIFSCSPLEIALCF